MVVAAFRSGSIHIFNAALIVAVIWLGSLLSYFMRIVWGISDIGVWRFSIFHIAAIIYLFIRWTAKNAQHRAFHLILLWTFILKVAYFVFLRWVSAYNPNAFGISYWWYQFFNNVLFEISILLVLGYAILFRRAQKDKGKYRNDVDSWFVKAGKARRAFGEYLRRAFKDAGKRP